MIDLNQTYRHLGRPWTEDQLAVRYTAANRRGEQLLKEAPGTVPKRPIALLATATPSTATLSVAIHLVHALPDGAREKLTNELLATTQTNAADALHRCHRALEHDGHAHGYTANEWPPLIHDASAPLLESLSPEPGATVARPTHPGGAAPAVKLDRLPRPGLARAPHSHHRHTRPPTHRVHVRRRRPPALRVARGVAHNPGPAYAMPPAIPAWRGLGRLPCWRREARHCRGAARYLIGHPGVASTAAGRGPRDLARVEGLRQTGPSRRW